MIELQKNNQPPAEQTPAEPQKPITPGALRGTPAPTGGSTLRGTPAPTGTPAPQGGMGNIDNPPDSSDSPAPEEYIPSISLMDFTSLEGAKHAAEQIKRLILTDKKAMAIAAGVVAAITLPFVYLIFSSISLGVSIGAAEDNYQNGNYHEAASAFEKLYIDSGDTSLLYKAALSYVLSGQPTQANAHFDKLDGLWDAEELGAQKTAEFHTAYALMLLKLQELDSLERRLTRAELADPDYVPASFAKSCAERVLRQSRLSVTDDQTALTREANLRTMEESNLSQIDLALIAESRQSCLANLLAVGDHTEMPFSYLAMPTRFDEIGIEFPVLGFDNRYWVNPHYQDPQYKRTNLKETITLLEAYDALQANDVDEAYSIMSRLGSSGDKTLLYQQLMAYLAVADGDYDTAEEIYGELSATYPKLSSFNIMHANAKVALSEGTYPIDVVEPMYKEALAQQAERVAFNNLLHLYLQASRFEDAGALLATKNDLSISSDFHLLINESLYYIAQKSYDEAEFALYSLFNSKSHLADNAYIYDALVHVLIESNKVDNAIALLRGRIEREQDVLIALKIAELFELRNQPFLALKGLEEAFEAFPEDDRLASRLLLEYVRRDNVDEMPPFLFNLHKSPNANQPLVLVAQALDASSATRANELFQQAYDGAVDVGTREKVLTFWLRRALDDKEDKHLLSLLKLLDNVPISTQNLKILRGALKAHRGNLSKDEKDQFIALAKQIEEESVMTADTKVDLGLLLANVEELGLANDLLEQSKGKLPDSSRLAPLEEKVQGWRATNASGGVSDGSGKLNLFSGNVQNRALEDDLKRLAAAVEADDYPVAIDLYTKLIETESTENLALTYQNRGAIYLKSKNYQAAQSDFQRALNIGTLSAKQEKFVQYNSSFALVKLKRYDEASVLLNQLLTEPQNQKSRRFWDLLLHAESNKKDSERTIDNVYRQAIQFFPHYYPAWAGFYRSRGKLDKAISILNDGISNNAASPALYRDLGVLYQLKGDAAKSREYFEISKTLAKEQKQ